MHTIGCREIHSQKFMDCLIEVKVQYSSKTTKWLINPTASVSITCLRKPELFQSNPLKNISDSI